MSARRFVNLLVSNREKGIYSLCRFDLSLNQFFYTKPEEVASHGHDLRIQRSDEISLSLKPNCNVKNRKQLSTSDVKTIRLPAPLVHLRPSPCLATRFGQDKLDCFPLSESKVLFMDPEGHIFSYDTNDHCIVTMPSLHARKEDPLALTIPGSGDEQDIDGSIYIIEKTLRPDKSFQFEALVSSKRQDHMYPWRTWKCHALPLPPYVLEKDYKPESILSCAVVDNLICISTVHHGTYCFDPVSNTWSLVGDWIMPFFGKAEYVPELSLWFGVSAYNYHLPCAADLSAVVKGQLPEQTFVWGDAHLPKQWHPSLLNPSKLVSLGSGRFCLPRIFETLARKPYMGELGVKEEFTVFTGLEVLDEGKGNNNEEGRLRVIKHKSRRCTNIVTNLIESLL